MNAWPRKITFPLFVIVAVLLGSPIWVPRLQDFLGLSKFLQSDSLFWLGLTLLGGLLGQRLIPDVLITRMNSTLSFFRARFNWISVILMAGLLLSLGLINRFILHSFMNSGDEHSCYFLAECIRDGKIWATPHPLGEFFEVVHVGNRDGKWFSVYPPGWPLLFALGLKLNLGDLVNPILGLAAAFFFFKVGKKIFGFAPACFGIVAMCVTPFFLLNSASYFSHTASLLMIAIFLDAYLKWMETRHVGWAMLCAFAVGYGLNTRYLTMAAVAVPFLSYELIRLLLRQDRWTRNHAAFGLILVLSVAFTLYYNDLITGDFFEAPNHYYHTWERLWFHDDYTPLDALDFIVSRIYFLMDWIPPVLLVLYVVSLFQNFKKGARHTLVRFGFFYPVIAYIFYYSWGGNQYGPRYYFEGLPFLTLSAGEIAVEWFQRGNWKTRKFLLGIVITALIGNEYIFWKQGSFYEQVSAERKSLYELAEQAVRRPAIVFIHGFLGDKLVMSEEDAVRNQPSLKDDILYAHDLGEKNTLLRQFYPDRNFYLGSFNRTTKKPELRDLLQPA